MTGKWLTPVVTAFDKDGNIDSEANKNIYDFLIKGGVDGLVIMGSTGEFFTMTMEQKKELIKLAVEHVNKRTKVFIGTSCMSADETIELSNYANEVGADAVMVISPYYFALSNESVELFYDKVAEGTKADIYLYNFPARTGYDLTPEVTLNLARKHKNIVGYKDTVTEMGHTRALIETMHKEFPEFEVYSGFDENFAHNILSGGAGCIGGLSNFAPEICSAWVKAINEKDFDKVAEIQKIINEMMAIYDIGTPFIPIVKKAMMIRGIEMQDYCTVPFIQANDEQTAKIKTLMEKLNLI
ncbi:MULTISPECIES: dihydrodipicolinate synthase family protein [Clostridium]|jgi:2-dehydro-3-deoxy-D-pentonate aldolase|uniref:Putative 2-keto-3-deoxy-galactonate aldolase YagE n=2 Tax=Clostridium TaxID=1485 RepID=A0A151AKN6_9CLOT|nr:MULTISPECIES: dihydrodipicolinate synthase family protein [Clostridium]KYH28192.1 putative 2-keto-3-deoxy-galactonate aldolase YagE [Clostridium colicanis DSM 13634]PRR70595.1 putative 2-keto-3-deoxy-galactonate aldolase YagE [Clostridium thermopalmarium DSM 5974]PVZ21675.1 4-hydroxy-tetrahydrodipicolinate synthase [Clostridium thermopalmarium DSM 5974]